MTSVQLYLPYVYRFIILEPYSEYSVSLNAITNAGNGTILTRTARTDQSSMYSVVFKVLFPIR